MSRTLRKLPYKLPEFTYSYKIDKVGRDGFSSKRSPDREWKKRHNRLLRKRQKVLLRQGKEFIINKKSHVWFWW